MSKTITKAIEIAMPQFAESVVTATIGKWLKKPGDRVEEYEPLCEVVTDKVTAELPSTVEGVLLDILVQEGETVDVGAIVCTIGDESGAASVSKTHSEAITTAPSFQAGTSAEADSSMRHRYSPAVRKLADDHGIDLEQVSGSGIGGRITRKDVQDFIEKGGQKVAVTPQQARIEVREAPVVPHIVVEPSSSGREYFIDVTPIRKTIAGRMHQSVSEIPHAWTSIEVDVTNLALLRSKVKDEFKRNEGINLTYMAFLIKAVVSAIKDFPIMNSVWSADKITVKRDINISLAVGTEDSVLTPVIHNADQKNIIGIAREVEELAARTRAGKLKPGDMQGGTFTINNTGTFGSILSYPIINYPQAAILTLESIQKKPVVIHDMIAIRSVVNLCLSFDHRILDGVICGRFHQRVKENLEAYGPETKLY